MNVDDILKNVEKTVPDENIFVDVLKDLVKEHIKNYLLEKLKENPALMKELDEAIKEYIEAKMIETLAETKFVKVMAELGIESLPLNIKEKVIKEFLNAFRKEFNEVIEKTF
ncbi:MAG: hypothetical protein ACP5RZ_02190 [Thermoplasmata archaeon]